MRKWNFRFGPYGNWILILTHICLFYPPKMREMIWQKNYTTSTMHAEIFVRFSRKSSHFRMIFAFSHKLKNAFSFQPKLDSNADQTYNMMRWCRGSVSGPYVVGLKFAPPSMMLFVVREGGGAKYNRGSWIDPTWSDIFRPPTRRVSQTIVFRYSEIEGTLCTK
jgi:hypothetical protein